MTMMPTIFDRSSPDLHKSNSNDISALSDETPPADHLKTQPRPKSFRIYNYSMTVKVNDVPAPVVVTPEKKSSGGSLGWFTLLLAPLALLRRRSK